MIPRYEYTLQHFKPNVHFIIGIMPAGKASLTKVQKELESSFLVKLSIFVGLPEEGNGGPASVTQGQELPAVKVIPPKRLRPQEISLQTAGF